MHAVFMVRQLLLATVVVVRRCRVMVFKKPKVIDKTGWGANGHTTSHYAGMIDTANVAFTSDIWHLALPPLHLSQQVYDK